MDIKVFPWTEMSRKPCSGSEVKEASNCHPLIKSETRLQTHRRVSEGAALHACPSFILFPSIHFQQTSSLHGPLVLPLTPQEGTPAVGRSAGQPWCSMSLSAAAHHPADPFVPCTLEFPLKGSQLWRGMVCRPMSL